MTDSNDIAKEFFEGQEKLNDLSTKVSRAGLLRAFKIVSSFPFVGKSVENLGNVYETELVKTALHLRGLADGFLKLDGMSSEAIQEEVVNKAVESVMESLPTATAQQGEADGGQEQMDNSGIVTQG